MTQRDRAPPPPSGPDIPAELAALFDKRPQVIKPGLARIEGALAALVAAGQVSPEKAPLSVIVGGTNGKGTTSGFLYQLAVAAGVHAGLFTSPHLVRFAERIQVAGRKVSDDELVADVAKLRAVLGEEIYAPLSFFEVNTLLAWRAFRRHQVDLDLLEVGLGGRWDTTNAADPCCSVIVSIGRDHMAFLGDSLSSIAAEKAGIMRRGRPVFLGDDAALPAEALAVIEAKAAELGCPLWRLGREIVAGDQHIAISLPETPTSRAVQLAAVAWPRAAGAWPGYKRRNFALALGVFSWLAHTPALQACLPATRRELQLPDLLAHCRAQLDAGLAPTPPSLAGRFHRLQLAPPGRSERSVLLDVGHNVEGVRAFVDGLRETQLVEAGRPLPGLVSILADKPFDAMLDVLRTVIDPLVLFPVEGERSWSATMLAKRHSDLAWGSDFADAWRQLEKASGSPLVICGSVHAVGAVLKSCGKEGCGGLST